MKKRKLIYVSSLCKYIVDVDTNYISSSGNIIANLLFVVGWASATSSASFIVGYRIIKFPAPVFLLDFCWFDTGSSLIGHTGVIALGVISDGVITGFSISVTSRTRFLMVFSATGETIGYTLIQLIAHYELTSYYE